MRKRFFSSIIILSGIHNIICAQSQLLQIIKSGQVEQKNFRYEIPFEYEQGLIVLKARVNNYQVENFILDSGAPVCLVSKSIIQATGMKKILEQPTKDANSSSKITGWYLTDSIGIDKLKFSRLGAMDFDFGMSPPGCLIKAGLIGMNAIDKCVWHIDFTNKKIILASSLDSFPGIKKAIRIPVTRNAAGYAFIDCTFNESVNEKLFFDLGNADGFITVSSDLFSGYKDPGKTLKSYGNGVWGAFSVSQDTVYTTRVRSVSLGNINFKYPAIISSKAMRPTLGNKIIQYYDLILNLKDNEIYLSPIPGKEFSQEFTTSGLGFDFKEGQLIVGTLTQNGPAEKAGLMLNDIVISINNRDSHFKDYCDFAAARSELQTGADTLTLKVKRNGEEKIFSFKKEKML